MAENEINARHLRNIISRLPDEVLQSILDKLPIADAMRTASLSHRWRDLWKYISIIKFGPSWVKSTGKDIVSSLNHFICLYQGQQIKRFSVKFTYQPDMSADVDSWVRFAIEKHVEELCLKFDVEDGNMSRNTTNDSCYVIPPSVFNCESLTYLKLSFCDLKLPRYVRAHSLRYVCFDRIELPKDAITTLTSNTPVLERLILIDCNRTRDLHIHVAPVPYFFTIIIIENFFTVNHRTKMDIKAPTAFRLEFWGCIPRSEYKIEKISDIIEVRFGLYEMFTVCGEDQLNILVNDSKALKYENILQGLLSSLQDAHYLRVCSWSLQLLSLRELRKSRRVTFDCTSLEITTSFQKWELPGIIYMLKACDILKDLVIEIAPSDDEIKVPQDFMRKHDFPGKTYLGSHICSLTTQLQNLETVTFKTTREYYETWEVRNFELYKFFHGSTFGLELLILLRINAENLKRMVFATNKQQHEVRF